MGLPSERILIELTRGLLALALAVAAAGCRSGEPVVMDLTASADRAAFFLEDSRIDVGAPEARTHLFDGWGSDERAPDGTTFVWGIGPASTFRFKTLGRRPLGLLLRGWPFSLPELPAQGVEVRLNGRTLTRWTLREGPAAYHATIPADALLLGENVLELRYARYSAPTSLRPGSTDKRELAAAWDLLEITGDDGAVATPAGPSGPLLVMPLGTGVSYSLSPGAGATLDLGGLELPDLPEGAPFLRASLVGSAGTATHDFRKSGGSASWVLPSEEKGTVLLRLEAMWEGQRPRAGARMTLEAPVIRGPVPRRTMVTDAFSGPPNPRPNVVIYVFDALRADRLGAYGHTGGLTPEMDAFAREGVVFERAFAASSWTRTSMATVLTGLSPRGHAVAGRDDALPATVRTLAERLQGSGYQTAAFVTNPNVAAPYGFDQGFQHFEYLGDAPAAQGHVRSDVLHARVTKWLDGRTGEQPFLLYVHSMDAHDPYVDPTKGPTHETTGSPGPLGSLRIGSSEFMRVLEEGRIPASPRLRDRLLALYEAGIRYNDARFGELLDHLAERSSAARTMVMLLADHGEEFADHGWWRHGKTLYAEQLHIPLVIRLPRGEAAGRRVKTAARQLDILPTLLEAAGAAPDPTLTGTSLLGPARGVGEATERLVHAQVDLDGRRMASLEQGGLKLIRYLTSDRHSAPEEWFSVDEDPGETRPLPEFGRAVQPVLRGLLENIMLAGRPGERRPAKIDARLEEQLRAVGYLR